MAVAQVSTSHQLFVLSVLSRRTRPASVLMGREQRLQTLVLGPARVAERPKRTCTSAVPAKKRVRASPYFVASAWPGIPNVLYRYLECEDQLGSSVDR
jgi:hypothetical protein